MSTIKIITNAAFYDSAYAGFSNYGAGDCLSFAQGPRHLSYSTATSPTTLWYSNNQGNLEADTFVMTRADKHLGHGLEVRSWSSSGAAENIELINPVGGGVRSDTYAAYVVPVGGGSAQIGASGAVEDAKIFDTANFAETLVGPSANNQQQDYILEFTKRSSRAAFGVTLENGAGGAYTKDFHQCFFGNAFEFSYAELGVVEQPSWETIQMGKYYPYLTERRLVCTFSYVSAADLQTFQDLPRITEEPFFIYDEDGVWLSQNLWHVICPTQPTVQRFDDLYTVSMELFRLRHYGLNYTP